MYWILTLRLCIEIARRDETNTSLWITFHRTVNYRLPFSDVEDSRFPHLSYFPVFVSFWRKKGEWERYSRAHCRNYERESSLKILEPQSGVKGQFYDGRRRQETYQWIMRYSGTEYRSHSYCSLFPLSWIIQCFVLHRNVTVFCSSFLVFAPDWAKRTKG